MCFTGLNIKIKATKAGEEDPSTWKTHYLQLKVPWLKRSMFSKPASKILLRIWPSKLQWTTWRVTSCRRRWTTCSKTLLLFPKLWVQRKLTRPKTINLNQALQIKIKNLLSTIKRIRTKIMMLINLCLKMLRIRTINLLMKIIDKLIKHLINI